MFVLPGNIYPSKVIIVLNQLQLDKVGVDFVFAQRRTYT